MASRETLTSGSVAQLAGRPARCGRPDESASEIARRMAEDEIGALPICDADLRVLGVITDRDVVVRVIAQGRDPERVSAGALLAGEPVTVEGREPLATAIDRMREHRVRRLPVVDGGRLVGMLSQSDVARAVPVEHAGGLSVALAHGRADERTAERLFEDPYT